MSIAAAVNQAIERAPAGRIFGYEVFPQYREAPEAVVRAVNRGVENRRLKRVAKGRFYKSRRGALGDVPVSDQECLRDAMYRDGRRVGVRHRARPSTIVWASPPRCPGRSPSR